MNGHSDLTISADYGVNDVVITLVGVLDHHTAAQSQPHMQRLFATGRRCLIVDVALLDECDRVGLALLLNLHCLCRAAGGWLRLVAPPDWLSDLLERADLFDMLSVYPTVKAARDGWLHERLLATARPGSQN